MRIVVERTGRSLKTGPRSLFGSKRPRFFTEPRAESGKSLSFKRKQRVRFRSRYAGSVAKQWSKTVFNTALAAAGVAALTWGSVEIMNIWNNSEWLRVNEVVFWGDVPDRLRRSFPIKPGDHLLEMAPSRSEKEILGKFPELERITIRRTGNRTVRVDGKYRTPVAMTRLQGEDRAIDAAGIPFHLVNAEASLPWIETPSVDDRKILLSFLSTWKTQRPAFYSLVKKIETDRMREFSVELSDGVLIAWGPVEEADIVERADKILRLRESFQPVKTPAGLLFVTGDRIVMDKNWRKAAPTGR